MASPESDARVCLIAEGKLKTGLGVPAAPGRPVAIAGAAHVLIGRALQSLGVVPSFVSPLRDHKRVLRGSSLHDPRRLARLLDGWLLRDRPALTVVLLDQDGDAHRRRRLRSSLAHVCAPWVLGVAKQEFEAWLIADQKSVQRCLGASISKGPDRMKPGEAKEGLAELLNRAGKGPHEGRLALAETAELATIGKRSKSWSIFLKELGGVAGGL